MSKMRDDEPGELSADEMKEDEIDRNLRESFPASDPPSWTLGTNHRERAADEDETQAGGGDDDARERGPE